MNAARALRLFVSILTPTISRSHILLLIGAIIAFYLALGATPASAEDPSFDVHRDLGAADGLTQSVAVGDMDGDGYLDIVVGNGDSNGKQDGQNVVFLNDGTGNFPDSSKRNFGTKQDNTRSVAVGDMNADGHLDIVVGSYGQRSAIYLNDSKGEFPSEPPFVRYFGTVSNTTSVALGDLNDDGKLDIVVGNEDQPNAVYLNAGAEYSPPQGCESGIGSGADSLAIGNLDKDGHLDIVLGSDYKQSEVYLNSGGGCFSLSPNFSSTKAYSIALGDMNGDGNLDIVTGRSVYLNNGAGNFSSESPRDFGSMSLNSPSVALGDMDNDGDLDIVLTGRYKIYRIPEPKAPNAVYFNDGEGKFQSWRNFGTGYDPTSSVALGDMDGDGHLDIVVGNDGQPNTVCLNDTAGSSLAGRYYDWGSLRTQAIAVGDMNSDGHLDIIISKPYGQVEFDGHFSQVYLNNGAGSFKERSRFEMRWPQERVLKEISIAVGDMDEDGHLDLVVGIQDHQNAVYWNDGTGNFADSSRRAFGTGSDSTRAIAVGDVDSDEKLDIIVGNDNENMVYLNDEQNPFASGRSFGKGADSIAVGDIDRDGDLDVIAGSATHQNEVYLNDGTGAFLTTPSIPFGPIRGITQSLATGDMDGDGYLDVIAGNQDQQNVVYLNDGSGHFPSGHNFGTGSDSTRDIAVGDMDGDGDLDIVVGNSPQQSTVYVNDGTGNFPTSGRDFGGELENSQSVALGDMDGDSDLDIVAGTDGGQNPVYLNGVAGNYEQPQTLVLNLGTRNSRWATIRQGRLSNNPPRVAALRPVLPKDKVSPPFILDSPTITFTYTLTDTEHERVGFICAWFSQDGGDHWQKAVPTTDTMTTNLAPGVHTFGWNTFPTEAPAASGEPEACRDPDVPGFFGQSDNVVFRLVAYPDLHPQRNAVPGPYQHPYASATTFPFRVRGTQVQVFESDKEVTGATVFLLPKGQSRGAELMGTNGVPFRTDSHGYLQGRGSLSSGGGLVALLPIIGTSSYTLYYTNAIPTATGVSPYSVAPPGVQTLRVSGDHPLLLFNLTVSLEWDARTDKQFLSQLEYDLGRTSELLYDWSNGQAALGQVNVYQDRQHWDDAQIRIYASNRLRPNAAQGGIVTKEVPDPDPTIDIVYEPGKVRMGAVWNRYGESTGNLGEDWPRALAHELGHYAFYLQDTYLGLEDGQVVPVDGCPGAMSDPYREDYSEFFSSKSSKDRWENSNCQKTLANVETGRWDWETIRKFYPLQVKDADKPWLNGTITNTGPSVLPLAVTQIKITDPVTTTKIVTTTATVTTTQIVTTTMPVEVPIYSLTKENGARHVPGPTARAILYQGDRLIDLGRPAVDQVVARGAREGDDLCVYEPDPALGELKQEECSRPARVGCTKVNQQARQLKMNLLCDWGPEILVTPAISEEKTTITITVPSTSEPMLARLYPEDDDARLAESMTPITTTPGVTQTLRLEFDKPVVKGYVQVWAKDRQGIREAVADFTLDGGSTAYKRLSSAYKRLSSAPVISADGQAILFGKDLRLGERDFYAIQALSRVGNAPPWATVVGQGYRLMASDALNLVGTSLNISYMAGEVVPGEEAWIEMYYSKDGASWEPLKTELDRDSNTASALVKDAGHYALMSSIRVDLPYEGWNMFSYPVPGTRPVSEALQSINGKYLAICAYTPNGGGSSSPAGVLPAPGPTNHPEERGAEPACGDAAEQVYYPAERLEFGRGYWIYVKQKDTTLRLKGDAQAEDK